jgi:hypothetical protein
VTTATSEKPGIVTIDGRDYATPAAWAAMTPGVSADQVRRAAMSDGTGLAAAAVPVSPGGKIKAYPVDLLAAWESTRHETELGQPRADCSTVAAELNVSKMRVWRAVNAGVIKAVRDEFGRWLLDSASVEQWKAAGMPGPRAAGHQ